MVYIKAHAFSFLNAWVFSLSSLDIWCSFPTKHIQFFNLLLLQTYDVLKRDGFKCCICGAKAKDGVKLEVDHIIPISKGGKSLMNNLQTLSERCNRGKRDKIN